jgi:hypothetical protein
MLINVNGKKIYNGECGFVRGNRSGRTFEIPQGILKKVENTISITNVTKETFGPFTVCKINSYFDCPEKNGKSLVMEYR